MFRFIKRSPKKIDKIIISPNFSLHPPKSDKLIRKTYDYILNNAKLDPIIVDKNWRLLDGYCSYLIVTELNNVFGHAKILQLRQNKRNNNISDDERKKSSNG